MSTAEMAGTFRRAAKAIRVGGLNQGNFWHGTAQCAVGALMAARNATVCEVEAEVGYLVDLLGGPDKSETDHANGIRGFLTVTAWNDTQGRTADEVVALLEQAAEKLEADQ